MPGAAFGRACGRQCGGGGGEALFWGFLQGFSKGSFKGFSKGSSKGFKELLQVFSRFVVIKVFVYTRVPVRVFMSVYMGFLFKAFWSVLRVSVYDAFVY